MKQAFLLLLATFCCFQLLSQKENHTVSVSAGYGFKQEWGIYIDYDDPDVEIWANHEPNMFYYLGYEYNYSKSFSVGGQIGYEKVNFESYYTDESYAKKYVIGGQWLGKFPDYPIHMQLGGFTNLGRIKSPEFDKSVTGVEFGVIVGPAYQVDNYGVALLFQPNFSFFKTSNDNPSDGMMVYPRALFKVFYTF
ncbi:MAG: hypothetical protein JXB49_07570 [Bacteroidales bacterium]|nr:hypothetical protein [Bacteroidales bacterium]